MPSHPSTGEAPGLCGASPSPYPGGTGHPPQQPPAPTRLSVGSSLSWENSSQLQHGNDRRDEGPLCRQHPAKPHKAGSRGVQRLPVQGRGPSIFPLPGHRFCIALAGFVNSPAGAGWGLLRLQSLRILPPGKSKGGRKGGAAQCLKRAW